MRITVGSSGVYLLCLFMLSLCKLLGKVFFLLYIGYYRLNGEYRCSVPQRVHTLSVLIDLLMYWSRCSESPPWSTYLRKNRNKVGDKTVATPRKLYEFISQKKTQNNDERKSECIAIPKQTTTNDDDDDDDDDDDNNNNNNNNNNTKFI